jgi:hypothetical protein
MAAHRRHRLTYGKHRRLRYRAARRLIVALAATAALLWR